MSPAGVLHGAVCRARPAAGVQTVHMEGHSGLCDPRSHQHPRREGLAGTGPEATDGSVRWERGVPQCAWFVACELAMAYNGMLAKDGHTVALNSPDLPMKHLTGCTRLRPEWLPPEVVGGAGWSAQVPQGRTVKYLAVMLGHLRRHGTDTPVYLRMHRFVCWLARGPPTAADHEVCHACSNSTCVRPLHLSWGSRSQNVRERAGSKRRK